MKHNPEKDILNIDILKAKLYEILSDYHDPYLNMNLMKADCLEDIFINACTVVLNLKYNFLLGKYKEQLISELTSRIEPTIYELTKDLGITLHLKININSNILTHAYKDNIEKIPNIKNIIAIGSGKGGVGKSTVAVNLALALQLQGARVGILDADLYGPSLPHMLGCPELAKVIDKKLQPHYAYGLFCISMGHLLSADAPVVWRGPMVSGGLLQLLHDTVWPELDYLIIDLPPGTGDIQLTLAQKMPVSGAVIVTTPQDIALLDAQKALVMLQKLNINILGVIENMSSFVCANCNHAHNIFGTNGGTSIAERYSTRLIGQIPLDMAIREQSDEGMPQILKYPDSSISEIYYNTAMNMVAELSKLAVDLKLDIGELNYEH